MSFMGISQELQAIGRPMLDAQLAHPTVRGIANGDLPEEVFRSWLEQDYLYLHDYVRVFCRLAWQAPDKHLGGMTSSGLGWTDLGDKRTIGGLSREFFQRVYEPYQSDTAWKQQRREDFGGAAQGTSATDDESKTMWVFEPHVAEGIFNRWIEENNIPVVHGRLDLQAGVAKRGPHIEAIRTEDGRVFAANVFIDATYEGDLLPLADVSHTAGRESRATYGESLAGRSTPGNMLPWAPKARVNPFSEDGRPLRFVLPYDGLHEGDGDEALQAYSFRPTITRDPERRIPFPEP